MCVCVCVSVCVVGGVPSTSYCRVPAPVAQGMIMHLALGGKLLAGSDLIQKLKLRILSSCPFSEDESVLSDIACSISRQAMQIHHPDQCAELRDVFLDLPRPSLRFLTECIKMKTAEAKSSMKEIDWIFQKALGPFGETSSGMRSDCQQPSIVNLKPNFVAVVVGGCENAFE